jgi:hypothetical protein
MYRGAGELFMTIFKREALVMVVGRVAWPIIALVVGYVVLRLVGVFGH